MCSRTTICMCPTMYVSYYYVCVLVLVYIYPHTRSSYYYICVHIQPRSRLCVVLLLYVSSYTICPHTAPHATTCVRIQPLSRLCVLILDTSIYGVLTPLLILVHMCPHTNALARQALGASEHLYTPMPYQHLYKNKRSELSLDSRSVLLKAHQEAFAS